MSSAVRWSALLFLGCAIAFAQKPAFEVASIKVAPPPDGRGMRMSHTGGPGTPDPGRWSVENWNLLSLVTSAYGVEWYQVTVPGWANELRFNIEAKLPPGAEQRGTIIVSFRVPKIAFDKRKSVTVTIQPYDRQQPVVLTK